MPDIQHPTTSRIYCLDVDAAPRQLLVVEAFVTAEPPALHGIYRPPLGASAEQYLVRAGWRLDNSWLPRSWGRIARVHPIEGMEAVTRRAARQALKRERNRDDDRDAS